MNLVIILKKKVSANKRMHLQKVLILACKKILFKAISFLILKRILVSEKDFFSTHGPPMYKRSLFDFPSDGGGTANLNGVIK